MKNKPYFYCAIITLVSLTAAGCGEKQDTATTGTNAAPAVTTPPADAGVPTDVKQRMNQSQQADSSARNAATASGTKK